MKGQFAVRLGLPVGVRMPRLAFAARRVVAKDGR